MHSLHNEVANCIHSLDPLKMLVLFCKMWVAGFCGLMNSFSSNDRYGTSPTSDKTAGQTLKPSCILWLNVRVPNIK